MMTPPHHVEVYELSYINTRTSHSLYSNLWLTNLSDTSNFVLMLTQKTFLQQLVNLMTEQRRHNLINKVPQQ